MILKINVKEKPTGALSFGGGYSSVENLFVTASISQQNFLGRGQSLTLRTQLGGTTSQLLLNFTEPWLFDIPLALTVNAYKWTRDYDNYSRDSLGGGFQLSYPIFTDTRVFGGYSFDVGKITDLHADAPVDIKELAGTFATSSVSTGITYDTRDRIINPSTGWDNGLSLEFAGLGGDIGYTKIIGELGYYHPLFWGMVGFVHFKTGAVYRMANMTLPDYEKFYLGGINSIRGFAWRDVHLWSDPVDDDDNPNTPPKPVAVGGGAMVQANLECVFPIAKSAGILGVIFFDTGNVFNNFSDISLSGLRRTAGFGIRWYSPMGPIRLEYGFVLDPKPEDSGSGRFEFTMGTAF
jgi:outer membrane protein insertion porin family